jgi:membrane protease subunit HflC
MSPRGIGIVIVVFLALGAAMNSFFIVDQTHQALVLRFGEPVNIVTRPGLQFKVPFVDTVKMYDRRILTLNADPKTVILKDQDRLIVDAYVTYQIDEPLQFYQAVRSERIMDQRLEKMLETSLREILGRENLNTLLSPKRSEIMESIRQNVMLLATGKKTLDVPEELRESANIAVSDDITKNLPAQTAVENGDAPSAQAARAGFGIDIVDVRIMRTDLPKATSDPIYNRMASDRKKVAERFRAEGRKAAEIIRSEAERKRTVMLADAERQADIIRSEGDAKAANILAKSFGQDVEFFQFYRAMQAYRKSMGKQDTTVILSPDHEFLQHMEP